MRTIIKISLIIALILGIVLMIATFIQAYEGYKNINYQENIRKLLTFTSKNRLKLNCYIDTEKRDFEVKDFTQFYLTDPDSVKEVTFVIKPKNEIRLERKITYHPIIGIIYYFPNANEFKVYSLRQLPQFNELCTKTEAKKLKLKAENLKKHSACDNPKNLIQDYNLECIYWNGKTIIGHLGEKISCDYKIVNETKDCMSYIEIKKIKEIEKYKKDCKTKCFKIPAYYLCKISKKNYYYNAILQTLKFFSKWNPDIAIIQPNNKQILINPLEFQNNKKTLESIVANLPQSIALNPVSFTTLANKIESYYQVNSMGDVKRYENQKKFAFYFTNQKIDNTICEEFERLNISLIVINIDETSNYGELNNKEIFKSGCHFVDLDSNDFNDIERFLTLFYDSTQNNLFSPHNLILQMNPQKPELVLSEKITKPINITIKITDEIKYLPITISLSGKVEVEMNIKREVCKARLLNETEER